MLYVHRSHKAYYGRGKRGRGEDMMNSSSTRSDPQRPRNNNVKEVGTPSAQSNLCTLLIAVSTAVQSKVTQAVSEKQLLKPEAKDRPTHYESPCSLSTSLLLILPGLCVNQ